MKKVPVVKITTPDAGVELAGLPLAATVAMADVAAAMREGLLAFSTPDEALAGLIPATVGGVPVVVAPFDEFALTPGDIGAAYGEIGDRFASLALAYVERPRLTLYAVRVEGE